MDRIYSEVNADDDHTIKRRISSILKVPRSPLHDLGSGNELTQGCDVEKRQRNSRRVSFADTIRVFPTDLQTNTESEHLGETAEAKHQEPLNQKEKPESVQCEITGMNTLLHAPIQTPLQETECHDMNSSQGWNKMNRTLLFSEENEMEMTAGHTVMITHDIGVCEETNKFRKIDFKSFSAELKLNKKKPEVNENNFLTFPIKYNEICPPQQKIDVGYTQKIKFDDFLKSLKSIKPFPTPAAEVSFLPSDVPERKLCSSEMNASFHFQGKSNITNVFGGLDNKTAVTQYCLSNEETIAPLTCASKQIGCRTANLHCGDENMDMTHDKAAFTELSDTTAINFKTNRKSGCLNNRVSPDPADKTVMFTVSEDMELTKPVYLKDKSLQTGFYRKPQVETGPDNHNIIGPATDKTVVFCLGDNEMEITKSCTVAVNHNFMQHCERDSQVLPLQPVDKTAVYASHDDMDMTKPNTCIIDQSLENGGGQAVHKLDYKADQPADKTVVFSLSDQNEMEFTRSHTVALNYGNANQVANIPIAMSVPPDKTVMFTFSEDMEITRPVAGAIDKSLKSVTGSLAVPQQGAGTGGKIKGITSDKTVVFSLAEDNEMEFTKSCTVAVDHNFMQHYETVHQVFSSKSVDKTVYGSHNYIDRNKPISCIIDQSLENAGAQAVHKLDNDVGGRTPIGSVGGNTVEFSRIEDNEMEITRSHTVAVDHDTIQQIGGAPQAPSQFPAERSYVLGHNSNMAVNKSTCFTPADKIMMLGHHNDIGITNPIEHITDSSQKNKETEIKKVILPGFLEEETVKCFLQENNEMEITKSLMVSVSHGVQQMEGASQELPLIPADKIKISEHNSNMITGVPADNTLMRMHSNDMKIIEPLIDTSLKKPNSKVMLQKGKETNKALLSRPAQGDAITVKLHDNEIEFTKCHTVKTNHDISQYERRLPVQFSQDSMDITGSHNDMKNMHADIMKLGKESKWEMSSNQTLALATDDNIKSAKRHSMLMNNKIAQHHQSVSKAELLIPINKNSTLTCYQDGKEINKLPPNATTNQSLEEKQALNKTTKQELSNMSFFTSNGITQDIDVTKNCTVNIYGPNWYVPNPEKEILHSVTKSREKTIAFADGETMEMTRNHTIGTEYMNTNNCNNELGSCSQTVSGAEFLPLVVPNAKELDITKTDKHMPEKSISSSNMELSVSVNKVNTQNLLKIQDNQLESHTSRINNLAEVADYVHCHEENECILPAEMLVQNTELCGEPTLNLNMEGRCMLNTKSETSEDYPGKLFLSNHKGNPSGVTGSMPLADTATNIDLGHVTKDWQTNLGFPINNFCSEEDLVLVSKLPSIVNDCSKLMNPEKKPEFDLISKNGRPSLGEELMKPKDPLELTEGIGIEFSNSLVSSELKRKSFTEDDHFHVPFSTMQKDNCQIKKLPLGIFPPKLPNKRKPTISNVEDAGGRTKPQDSENSLLIKKSSDKITQYLSPSHYISEELLPSSLEEMDSSELLNCELQEKLCDVMDEKESTDNEGHLKETNRQKRIWNQEGEEIQKVKKLKVDEGWSDTTQLKQPFSNIMVPNEETLEGRTTQDMMASNMERTHSSNGSSLDSIKADSDLSTQRNAVIEAELLMDSTCEQNLQEKLQEGVITVGEFFTLLQVHILIQKPRQSLLLHKYTVNSSPTSEDLILSKYVYHPKLQIYNEDCQALSEIIEELKLCADNKDKLLVNMHKSLWEVMRTCSDDELKQFGAELNKMKSCFAKKSKVLAHRGKAKLYTKLVQNAQLQWEKLQSRLNEMDELFNEVDNCLVALEAEIDKLEKSEQEVNESLAEYESKLRQTEQELEDYNTQEEALQREQSNLRGQQEQRVSEIRHLQEEAKRCQEHMEEHNFSKWMMKEWNDQQAVFTFLCDSIKLTVALGCPVDAADFITKNLYRQIDGVHFESLLDEAKAPMSSKLVQRLIFQFITDHCSWQEKYSTVHHLRQLLRDLSLVVSRCQLLGEEIEFLNKWGGKFNLLKTTVNDSKVKLLFSSSLVFAKFEVELSLSANYPTSPVAFTVQKYTGYLGQEDISEVLTRVPVGPNYLKRMVSQIHHSLLQNPSAIYKQRK